jgi:hypothetical protein
MRAKLMHTQRGQAVVETVVFLPLFLLALFGIMWAVQAGVQYERVESAVRYNGLISQGQNPYLSYSLYAMYLQLGVTTMPLSACVEPISAPLSDAAPTFTSGSSAPFWSPSALQGPNLSCSQSGTNGIVGIAAGTGLVQDVFLSNQTTQVTSTVPVTGTLQQTLSGSFTKAYAQGTFFKPVGVNVILACYPTLNTQITSSLQYTTDTSTATMPAALGSTVSPITPSANSNCTTW